MRTPGPVAANPFGTRLPLERGRDAMGAQSRESIIPSMRKRLAERPHDFELRDTLACQLLGYSAVLMETGRLQEALTAVLDADEEVVNLAADPFFREIGVPGRVTVLSAACSYNMSVLFYEADNLAQGSSFLKMAVEKFDQVAAEDRGLEIYTSFKSALDQLVHIARTAGL